MSNQFDQQIQVCNEIQTDRAYVSIGRFDDKHLCMHQQVPGATLSVYMTEDDLARHEAQIKAAREWLRARRLDRQLEQDKHDELTRDGRRDPTFGEADGDEREAA